MRALMLLVSLLAVGCIREPIPSEAPPRAAISAPGYGWPPEVSFAQEYMPETAAAAPGASTPVSYSVPPASVLQSGPPGAVMPPVPGTLPPAGDACIEKLQQLAVPFNRVDARKGVHTPVVVSGPIGGIRYVAGAGLPLELDCRMAVTLAEVAPILVALNVTELRFSGAYVYRMSRVGRLSLHAYGLALDVHAARANGNWLEVTTHFARGLGDGCAESAPVLNRIACELKRTGRFKEMLTPDYNADHHDHLHWGVAPLPEVSTGPSPNSGSRNLTRP